jgi:hypothetical protein
METGRMMARRRRLAGLLGVLLWGAAVGTVGAAELPGEGEGASERWIRAYVDTPYDALAWGCRLKHCSHVHYEMTRGWKRNALAKRLVGEFEAWFERDGERILADWRKGAVKAEDRRYLPLVKTVFWDGVIRPPRERRRAKQGIYWRFNPLPRPVSPDEEEYQAVLARGLTVLHKIYNRRPLTAEDKVAFHEWLLAYYCNYYVGGVTPTCLPADSWKEFGRNLLGIEARTGKRFPGPLEPGAKVHNFRVIDPESIWGKPSFKLDGKPFDNCWHLKPERLDDIIATYGAFAEAYYEPTDEYPLVKPKDWPAEAPDTERAFTFYNYLGRERRPVVLGRWFANRDEANCRMVMFMHLHYRAFAGKLNWLFPEPGYQALVEKNHLVFNMDDEMRARMILWESVPYVSMLPKVYIGNVAPLGPKLNRVYLVNRDGAFLSDLAYDGNGQPHKGHSWDMILTEMLGFDANLVRCFGTDWSAAEAPVIVPWGEAVSRYGKSLELSSANGYNNKRYNRYAGLYDVVGEVVAVDTTGHTMTVLREEFEAANYPNYLAVKRFDLKPVAPQVALFDRFKKEGNSREARTWVFKVNPGVYTFVNGKEVRHEGGFEKGDVVSVMTKDGMDYPYLIRAIRFNFPPTVDAVGDVTLGAGAEVGRVLLSGISDGNAVSTQEVRIEARSSDAHLLPDPKVRYEAGASGAALMLEPAAGRAGTAEVEVTIRDSGGTYDGGKDTTVISFKVSVGAN